MTRHPGRLLLLLVIALAISGSGRLAYATEAGDGVDQTAAKAALLKAYPGLFTISGNVLTWTDGTTMVWDDGKARDAEALLESPDIEDMFRYVYPTAAEGALVPVEDFDPGRIRNEAFFEKLYGKSAAEVGKHIANTIGFMPQSATKHVFRLNETSRLRLQRRRNHLATKRFFNPPKRNASAGRLRCCASSRRPRSVRSSL